MARKNPRIHKQHPVVADRTAVLGRTIPIPNFLPGGWDYEETRTSDHLGDPFVRYYNENSGRDLSIMLYPEGGDAENPWKMGRGVSTIGRIDDDETAEADKLAQNFMDFVKQHAPEVPLAGVVPHTFWSNRNPRRARKNTGYVAPKIRAHTAKKNAGRKDSKYAGWTAREHWQNEWIVTVPEEGRFNVTARTKTQALGAVWKTLKGSPSPYVRRASKNPSLALVNSELAELKREKKELVKLLARLSQPEYSRNVRFIHGGEKALRQRLRYLDGRLSWLKGKTDRRKARSRKANSNPPRDRYGRFVSQKNPRRARKNTGYVAPKIRAHTAKKNPVQRSKVFEVTYFAFSDEPAERRNASSKSALLAELKREGYSAKDVHIVEVPSFSYKKGTMSPNAIIRIERDRLYAARDEATAPTVVRTMELTSWLEEVERFLRWLWQAADDVGGTGPWYRADSRGDRAKAWELTRHATAQRAKDGVASLIDSRPPLTQDEEMITHQRRHAEWLARVKG